MSDRIIIYSHGFGVQKDDRGLFTDIANSLPEFRHVLFDYNEFNPIDNILTVAPLDAQARLLEKAIDTARNRNTSGALDLICHSQGCVVAAMASLRQIDRIIFLAPPASFAGVDDKIKQMLSREGAKIDKNNQLLYPRRDGTITLIPAAYWQSREGITPIRLYNKLGDQAQLVIINAAQDEVLTDKDFSAVSDKIQVMDLDANHDFTGIVRSQLISQIQQLLI